MVSSNDKLELEYSIVTKAMRQYFERYHLLEFSLVFVHCNRLESNGNRGLGPASVILIVARRTKNASVDSYHVARMTILILESSLLIPTHVHDL